MQIIETSGSLGHGSALQWLSPGWAHLRRGGNRPKSVLDSCGAFAQVHFHTALERNQVRPGLLVAHWSQFAACGRPAQRPEPDKGCDVHRSKKFYSQPHGSTPAGKSTIESVD